MKIKDDYIVKDILGNVVIIPIGQNYINKAENIFLNSEGAFFIRNIKSGKNEEEIADLYADLFSEDIDDARLELQKFIKKGIDKGFLESN